VDISFKDDVTVLLLLRIFLRASQFPFIPTNVWFSFAMPSYTRKVGGRIRELEIEKEKKGR
jgi:hypothetical protein